MIYRSPFKATGPTRARLEKIHALSASRVFSFRSHEIAHINHLITNQLDLMRWSFAFRFYEFRTWKNGSDERALRTFGTGVWGRGFRSG